MKNKKNRFMYETAFDVGSKLSAGDNGEFKNKGEQTGSGMVSRMAEDHEIKAESAGFATENNKYNSSNS
ncbi:MAG: hypothetical protein GXY05_05580 [Clostridiales bacterium]|mgnify:CR=1 FL=1|nr:hypothetical protein [Clostridiales bacterium]